MIDFFVNRFISQQGIVKEKLSKHQWINYIDLVKLCVETITDPNNEYGEFSIDPERIHEINDGDYQGTLLFIIPKKGYQPSNYWYIKVYYGSCGACDTLASIYECSYNTPTRQQIDAYYTLCLHIVQNLKKME